MFSHAATAIAPDCNACWWRHSQRTNGQCAALCISQRLSSKHSKSLKCSAKACCHLECLFSCNAGCMLLCSSAHSLLDSSLPSFAICQLTFQINHLHQHQLLFILLLQLKCCAVVHACRWLVWLDSTCEHAQCRCARTEWRSADGV